MTIGEGPSPRARGIRARPRARSARPRSIPASAGNPPRLPRTPSALRVHPRERGESAIGVPRGSLGAGPSPRARGIPRLPAARSMPTGSIPASAGNPGRPPASGCGATVHPRERGESGRGRRGLASFAGPSPRARGIPGGRARFAAPPGSIPASAGNPRSAVAGWPASRVHPRERGESGVDALGRAPFEGPSPRARGIPSADQRGGERLGSIPASAGNPPMRAPPGAPTTVHPRERGESTRPYVRPPPAEGPSPRARGIHLLPSARPGRARSIPASAGNPRRRWPAGRTSAVHPRERGESRAGSAAHGNTHGPSPRARGIRYRQPRPRAWFGSIPASAGNPGAGAGAQLLQRVHPRERGESPPRMARRRRCWGPSPRARGIPPAGRGAGALTVVHPRERGESGGWPADRRLYDGPSPRARGIPAAADVSP